MNEQNKPGGHILVVDDEPLVVDALCSRLEIEGHRTDGVHSGEEARQALEASLRPQASPIDLVVLDRAMPEIDGLQVCRWIKEDPRLSHIPVLMLTALVTAADKVKGLDTGADDYVTKPYHTDELLARIHALLRSSRIERQLYQVNQQLATLNKIITAITSPIKVDEILSATLRGIQHLWPVEASSLLLQDRKDGQLFRGRVISHGQESSLEGRIEPGKGLLGHVVQTRRSLMVNETAGDARFCPDCDKLGELVTRSAMIVPLMVKEKLTGVIETINKKGEPFSQGDLDLLRSMAASVVIALENARLFDNLRTAYRQVQASSSTLLALFDGITDGLYIVDRRWQLVAVNQGRARQASAEPASLVKHLCYQVLHDRKTPCPDCQVGTSWESGQGGEWVERQRSPDNLFTEWELFTYPIFDRTGHVIQAIILRREVTEQRRLEASLAQATKLAAVGQLAAGVAHEINNPLTAIIANAQFLKEDLADDDDAYQSAELIARAGERAARVVRRLLDFARQEGDEIQRVDINASLRESLVLLDHQLSTAKIQVLTQLEPNLPPINASADRIQSIWLNLLVNAKDALSKQPGARRIETLSRRQGEQIEVSISDNGPGIPAEQIPYLFHPFYTTKSPGKGTGLGLSTSYRTVEQLGGRIDIISEPGQGTTVTVSLPLLS